MIGMLAIALINHYGGNVYDIYQDLIYLKKKGKFFEPLDDCLSSRVRNCLDWKGESASADDMIKRI